jgi:hypothetical protein
MVSALTAGCLDFGDCTPLILPFSHFLLEHDVPARLVFIYFCGDNWGGKTLSSGKPPNCPKKAQGWDAPLKVLDDRLGLNGQGKLEARVHSLFLRV